jgi:sugar phosphate isomerase/epimerase
MVKKIGYSLPLNYFAVESVSEYNPLFGSVDDCLAVLRASGINSVELKVVGSKTPAESVINAIDKLAGYGMSTTIHGVLPGITDQHGVIPALSCLSSEREWIVTMHCYGGVDHSSEWYAERSVTAITKLLNATPDNIKVALEINRAKSLNDCDPSVTYQGVLDMINAVDSPRLGICWDYGHTMINIQNKIIPTEPPAEFPSKVIQTHIHDVSDEGRTHFPLTHAKVPLERFNTLLLDAGYTGCFNLEMALDRWSETPSFKRNRIIQSIQILSDVLK